MVAHEIGHGKNWNMLLMTVVQLVPLILYFLYRTAMQMGGRGKDGGYRVAVAVSAYVLYIVSEYVVLWFSRCREYYADRFAGNVTGNPGALASALVKIGYGLAARGQRKTRGRGRAAKSTRREEKEKGRRRFSGSTPSAPMGIFDRKGAVAMVASSASLRLRPRRLGRWHGDGHDRTDGEQGKPQDRHAVGLVESLGDLLRAELHPPADRSPPAISFRPGCGDGSRAVHRLLSPETRVDRDDFAVDVLVILLPLLLFMAGVGCGTGARGRGGFRRAAGRADLGRAAWLVLAGLPILGLGIGSLIKTLLVYRGDHFAPLSVTGLLHKVKVSNVRPVPARLRGTIIGKGVPGLIWSEDFVMRDATGILFLDYRQPLRIWEWLFGLFRAGDFTGKTVEVARLVPMCAGAVPRAQVNHDRRPYPEQLRSPRAICRGLALECTWASGWSSPGLIVG